MAALFHQGALRVFLLPDRKFAYFVIVLEDLKIDPEYDGFLYLAESVRNPPLLKPHYHRELELNLIVQGSVTYVVGGNKLTLGKRDQFWLFPSQEHQLVNRSSDAQYYVAVFTPEMLQDACRGKMYRPLKSEAFSKFDLLTAELTPREFEAIRREMDELMSDGIHPDLLNREAGFGVNSTFRFRHNDPDWLNAGLRHLLLSCWRIQQGRSTDRRKIGLHPLVRRILALLEEARDSPSLDELARECGVSSTYLSRLFRKELGTSLTRYKNSLRLSRFMEAYRSASDEDVMLNAAYEAGFGSYAQFYRVFREAYGKSPRDCFLKPRQQ